MKRFAAVLLCLLVMMSLVACGGKTLPEEEDGGPHEGEIGGTMETYFFDFTVTNAYCSESYGDYVADDSKTFLVVNVTVRNTGENAITMYDTDFQARWGDEDEEEYSYPITAEYSDGLVDAVRQFPEQYDLDGGKSRSGELVFMVPSGRKTYTLEYLELFVDAEGETVEGDLFIVSFEPDIVK